MPPFHGPETDRLSVGWPLRFELGSTTAGLNQGPRDRSAINLED